MILVDHLMKSDHNISFLLYNDPILVLVMIYYHSFSYQSGSEMYDKISMLVLYQSV